MGTIHPWISQDFIEHYMNLRIQLRHRLSVLIRHTLEEMTIKFIYPELSHNY